MAYDQLVVNGTTYYFTDINDKIEVNKYPNETEMQVRIDRLIQEGKVATSEEELQELKENGGQPITEESTDSKVYEGDYYNSTGFGEAEMKIKGSSVDLSIVENLNDVADICDQIDSAIDELDNIDVSDYATADAALNKIAGLMKTVDGLRAKLGFEPSTAYGVRNGAGMLAVGMGVAAGYATATGVSATAFTIMGASVSVPGAGWIVAGIAAGVGIGAWLYGASQDAENQAKLDKLEKRLDEQLEKLDEKAQNVTSDYKKETEEGVIQEIKDEIGDFLSASFSFDDITDVSAITDNIDKLYSCNEKLQPYIQIADKWGITLDGLDDIKDKIDSEENTKAYAQSYIDSYADEFSYQLTNEAIEDTENLNDLYANLEKMINALGQKGLDTTKLEELLVQISTDNQTEVDDKSEELEGKLEEYDTGSDITENVTSNLETGAQGINLGTGVQGASSSYQTNTDALSGVNTAAQNQAQSNIQDYAQSVTTEGKSFEELQKIYDDVSSTHSSLSSASSNLDLSVVIKLLEEIKAAQQAVVEEYSKTIETKISSTIQSEDIFTLYQEIVNFINSHTSDNVDLTIIVNEQEKIREKEQEKINQNIQNAINQSSNATSSSTVGDIINNINIDLSIAESMQCDISGLQAALVELNKKFDELLNKELNFNFDQTINIEINQPEPTPAPTPEPTPEPTCPPIIFDEITGNPEAPIDKDYIIDNETQEAEDAANEAQDALDKTENSTNTDNIDEAVQGAQDAADEAQDAADKIANQYGYEVAQEAQKAADEAQDAADAAQEIKEEQEEAPPTTETDPDDDIEIFAEDE